MLDELLVGGEMQETSKRNIIRAVTAQDMLQEVRDLASEIVSRVASIPKRDPAREFKYFLLQCQSSSGSVVRASEYRR